MGNYFAAGGVRKCVYGQYIYSYIGIGCFKVIVHNGIVKSIGSWNKAADGYSVSCYNGHDGGIRAACLGP